MLLLLFPVSKLETIMLKSQDILIALKYWLIRSRGQDISVREVAASLGISYSEVSKGANRLQKARLLVERDNKWFIEKKALFEWLRYGLRYFYAVEGDGYGRGMPSGWNCPLINSDMLPPSPALVWKIPQGEVEGLSIEPIHRSAIFAAQQDKAMYELLALIDIFRIGKAREIAIAEKLLKKIMK